GAGPTEALVAAQPAGRRGRGGWGGEDGDPEPDDRGDRRPCPPHRRAERRRRARHEAVEAHAQAIDLSSEIAIGPIEPRQPLAQFAIAIERLDDARRLARRKLAEPESLEDDVGDAISSHRSRSWRSLFNGFRTPDPDGPAPAATCSRVSPSM